MNAPDLESQTSTIVTQETADASSTCTAEPTTNCQPMIGNLPERNPPPNEGNSTKFCLEIGANMDNNLKVFAPVMTHDVTLPNTTKKVPMVMVPVPDSRTLMAVPISTLNHLNETKVEAAKDEQQARDLLVWNDGVGTLNGCDLRFKINQLGCLELIDSDDESENQNSKSKYQDAISNKLPQPVTNSSQNKNSNSRNNVSNNKINNNGHIETNSPPPSSTSESKAQKRMKTSRGDTDAGQIRQISPGSSLLRDGPDIRRPKSSVGTNISSTNRPQANSLSLLKKIERNQNSILLEKLVPKQRLEEIKTNVDQWTVEDVRKFVDSIPGCAGYGELFESQQICGKSLLYLDQRDLLDVINVKLGPAVKICHAISLLKSRP